MFADDTDLFISEGNIDALFQQMNRGQKGVSTWFKANKLSKILIKPNGLFFISLRLIFNDGIDLERERIT